MQTATATSPRKADMAFNRLAELKPSQPPADPEDRRERYFVFMGDFPGCPKVRLAPGEAVDVGGTTVDTRCIPDRVLWRGLVTPCTTTAVDAPHYAIPTGRKLAGTEKFDKDRNLFAAKMNEPAGPAAQDLIDSLGNPHDLERQRGLVEVAPELLRGKSFEEVREFNLTFIFFPNWPYDVPQTHGEARAKVEEAIQLLESNQHPEFEYSDDPAKRINNRNQDTQWIRKLYLQTGEAYLKAIDDAERWHNHVAEKANTNIGRSDTDAKHKDGFDPLDETAFLRTGIIKTTRQMQEMVKASRENRGANDKVADAVVLMAETLASQRQAPQQVNSEVDELKQQIAEMREMLKQSTTPKPAEKTIPAAVVATAPDMRDKTPNSQKR